MNDKPIISPSSILPGWLTVCVVWSAVLLFSACSTHSERPDWLDNAESSYPAATHLTATGSADDRQTASDRALANLARIFEVQVQDSSMDVSRAIVNAAQGQQQITNEQKITRTVSTETRHILQGAQVLEYWQNEQAQTFALAVLAKQPASMRFRQSILAADGEIRDLIRYASMGANNPLSALNALKRARSAQIQRDQLNQNLMIVAEGRGIKSDFDEAAVDTLIRNALGTLPITVQADDASVKAELQRALIKLGVKTVAQSAYVLHGTADMAPVSQQQGWFWLRGSYELMLQHDGVVMAKQRWPVKVSAADEGMLQQRARDELNAKLPGYLFELLSSEPD